MKLLLFTMLAGAVGTAARFGATRWGNHLAPGFPWGTLAVNVLGAFLAGFLFVWLKAHFAAYEAYFPVIFLGFLGAFTTFSTFALESARFLSDAEYAKFAWNVLLQNGTGIIAALGGMSAGKFLA